MKNILFTTILFFYIYPIPFIFLPFSTRVAYGLLGFTHIVILLIQRKRNFSINKNIYLFLLALFSIGFISLISISINSTLDVQFIKYCISISVILLASYFVIYILKYFKFKFNFFTITNLIINAILTQSIISFVMFLFPNVRELMLSIQRIPPDVIELMSNLFEFRVVGFGIYFFGAGIISGLGLILIGMLIRNYTLRARELLFLSIKFLLILVIGMMMARTTLIGGLLGLVVVFFPRKIKATISMINKKLLFLIYIIIIPIVLMLILFIVFPNMGKELEQVLSFAFEIFINYFETGHAESVSTNRLEEMYIYPENISTWIIGDGYWNNPYGPGYYMHTDVGYLRLIYYFGLIGLGVYLAVQFYAIKLVFEKYSLSPFLYGIVFAYLLILNLKGFADLLSFIFLYWMSFILVLESRRYKFAK